MYKELVISIVIIVAIVLLDVGTLKYTNMAIDETIKELSEIKETMKNSDNDHDKTITRVNEIYEKWNNYHDKLAFFIEHDELEKVETDFVAAKSYLKNKQYDLADAEIEKTIFVLEHISDKYDLNLENIF